MAGSKRTFSGNPKTMPPPQSSSSPYMPMFETFRSELDEHHDRRERIIKASRDTTALSKKMIFSLQRAPNLAQPLPASISTENTPRLATITSLLTSLVPDLQNLNAWRYRCQISPGLQELVEALSFQHYLTTQQLLTWQEVQAAVPEGVLVTEEDYVLGLFDLVGEVMRFAITNMATNGKVPGRGSSNTTTTLEIQIDSPETSSKEEAQDSGGGDIVTDLRTLRACFEALDTKGGILEWGVAKKMDVMKTCVEKVENAVYGMIVRGRERPKGWVMDSRGEDRPPEPVESY